MYANETQIKFTSQIVAFLKWIVLKVKVKRIKIKFSRLKNLTRHFVHTEPFYIFAQFTRNCRTVIKIASLDLLLFRPVEGGQHLRSPNGTSSIVLTCIKRSHGANYLFIQFQNNVTHEVQQLISLFIFVSH